MKKYEALSSVISTTLDESGYRTNPFFSALRDGSFAQEDFVETQIQFYFAVVFFSRPMAALAAKIPTPALRLEVLRNVWEEHGSGDLQKVHGTTFIELLKRLGNISPADVEARALCPAIRAFNTTLTAVCVQDDYLTAVGVMGIIERMFSEISAWIGQGIVAREWLTSDRMVHYSLHEELDIKHSQDFFDILEPAWNNSPEDRYAIDQGLKMGAYIFNRLYEDLYRTRKTRLTRDVRCRHSRAEG